METEAQKNRASTPTAALESARQLASGSVVPEKWNESASSLQHELRELREPLQLEVPEVAQLLTHVAAVIRASLGVVEQLESHGELMRHTMGAAAGLMVEACGWAVQHGQALQQLGPAALAGSLTTLVLESLGFSRAAMYSPRWLKALGSEGFGSCANTMRASVKDMAALVHGLVVAWWADLESSAGPCADVDALHAVIASGPGGSDLASLVDAAVGQLSALGRDAAQVLTRGDASPEMKSLGTVNVAWGGLMKMMTGLPAGAHAHLLSGKWPALVIEECLGCLRGWLQLFLRLPYDVSKTKVLRFWTMHLTKLLGTHVTCATCFWPQLTALTFEVYLAIASSESDPGACGDLEAHVAPKLIDLMMMCLEEEAQVEGHSEGEGEGGGQGAPSCLNAVTAKVDLLASSLSGCGPTLASAAYSDGPAGPPMPSPRELLSRVQLCCTLLYRSPLLSSAPGLLALATRLLPALLSAASVDLYAVFSEQMHCVGGPRECLAAAAVALVSAASELAQQQQAQTQQQGSGGSGSASAGSVAVKAWREALGALYRAGVSTHPALSHLGGAALAVLVARQHPRDASAQLVDLGTAVRSLAVAEVAVAASADWDAEAVAGGGAREGTDTDAGSSGGEGDGGRNSPGARASTAATTVLDAGPAAGDSPACRTARLLATLAAAAPRGAAAHAAVVLQLGGGANALAASGDAACCAAYALLTHAVGHEACALSGCGDPGTEVTTALTAADLGARLGGLSRRLSQLLAAGSGGGGGSSSGSGWGGSGGGGGGGGSPGASPSAAVAASSLHAACVLMAADVTLAQCESVGVGVGGVDTASQGAALRLVASAAQVLCDWGGTQAGGEQAQQASAWGGTHQAQQQQQRQRRVPPHVVWALRVVARGGARLPRALRSHLHRPLMLLLAAPSGAHAPHVAAAAAHLSDEPLPQALFHPLLLSPEWPVAHEAMRSWVAVSRVAAPGADTKGLVPRQLLAVAAVAADNGDGASGGSGAAAFSDACRAYVGHSRQPGETASAAIGPLLTDARVAGEANSLAVATAEAASQRGQDTRLHRLGARLRSGLGALGGAGAGAAARSGGGGGHGAGQQQQQQGTTGSGGMSQGQGQGQPQHAAGQHEWSGAHGQSRAQVAALTSAVAALQANVTSLATAAHDGSLLEGLPPGMSVAEARAQLAQHSTYLLGELASATSKLRSLADLADQLRCGITGGA